jgi:superfamily II DNA or RNA helicase/DNA-binding transcriptional regulator YhcF (GntR family)
MTTMPEERVQEERLRRIIYTINERYAAHLERGNHILRPGSQLEMAYGEVDYYRANEEGKEYPPTIDYEVAPCGLGKTVVSIDKIVGANTTPDGKYVLSDPVQQMKYAILVPNNKLVDQWGDRFLGKRNKDGTRQPSIFGDKFRPEDIGIYHADASKAEREEALKKPIVIIVNESARIVSTPKKKKDDSNLAKDEQPPLEEEKAQPDPLIKWKEFAEVIIDETDDRARGPITRAFIQKEIMPYCKVHGLTATPIYRNGKSIGDYLYDGKSPSVEITHEQAVDRREIAGDLCIPFMREIKPESQITLNSNREYTEKEQEYFIEQAATDEAIIQILKVGVHPKTGVPLTKIPQMHKGVNIADCQSYAKKLNAEFGENFAAAIWGEMGEKEYDDIMERFEKGEITALVQCKMAGRGWDWPPLQMTVQRAPMLSPNDVEQFHERANRLFEDKEVAIHLYAKYRGIRQVEIPDLLGGMVMIAPEDQGWEFPTSSQSRNPNPEFRSWPEVKGVEVVYTTEQREMYAKERLQEEYENGLPKKPKNMLDVEEMAKELGVPPEILAQRVYTPLEKEYDIKRVRDKFVMIEAGEPDRIIEDDQDKRFVRIHAKHRFPAWRIGHYRENDGQQNQDNIKFCVDASRKELCGFALYGRLEQAPPECLSKEQALMIMDLPAEDEKFNDLWGRLQQAFFNREPYQRSVEIEGLKFSYEDFGFHRNASLNPEFFVAPDVLKAMQRYCTGADEKQADEWSKEPSVQMLKTADWLTCDEAISRLPINAHGEEAGKVRERFKIIASRAKRLMPSDETDVSIGRGADGHEVHVALKSFPQGKTSEERTQICVSSTYLEHLKSELDLEAAIDAPKAKSMRK